MNHKTGPPTNKEAVIGGLAMLSFLLISFSPVLIVATSLSNDYQAMTFINDEV